MAPVPPPAPVTVVVVAHRHAAWVGDCMASIAAQTARPAQVIVVDDASGDGTAEAIRESAARFPEIPWELRLHPTNRGLTAHLAEALATAREPYFTYISGDDRMLPERLEVQLAALREAPAGTTWSYSDALREDEHRTLLPEPFSVAYVWPAERPPHLFRSLVLESFVPAPSVLAETAAMREAGGYDPDIYYEDFDLLLRLSLRGDAVGVDTPLVVFRELPTSLGHTTFSADNPRFLAAMSASFRKHLGAPTPASDLIPEAMWFLALRRWRAGDADAALRSDLRRTWRDSPAPVRGLALAVLAQLRVPGRWTVRGAR